MVITYTLMGITILVSLMAFNKPDMLMKYMMNPYRVQNQKQYYRFITSGFLHRDYGHLFLNMFSFYFFGNTMEAVFLRIFGPLGNIYFVALYLLAIIVSDIPSYFKHKNNPGYNSLGASGGVAAVIFASIIFMPLNDICILILCLPGFILGTLYLIYSYFQGRKSNDNINHDAHLYGALFGLLFCIVMYPPSIGNFFQQVTSWKFFN
jgi:membrane associated rhomboid family serine protease